MLYYIHSGTEHTKKYRPIEPLVCLMRSHYYDYRTIPRSLHVDLDLQVLLDPVCWFKFGQIVSLHEEVDGTTLRTAHQVTGCLYVTR
jgi:hypothetical protein